jgi:hypothetical protein
MTPTRPDLPLDVAALAAERLDEAYPLVRSARGASAAQWRDFVTALRTAGGGLLAATAADGRIHGVAAWRPCFCLVDGNVLVVDLVAAMEISAPARVRPALCAALAFLGRERGCGALLFVKPGGRAVAPDAGSTLRWDDLELESASALYRHRLAGGRTEPATATG